MPTAKSYIDLPKLSEPYKKSNKMYIDVKLKNGNTKSVRWYIENEYAKMYPEEQINNVINHFHIFGFDKGYITLYLGVTKENEEWFYKEPSCRFAVHWGWYTISTEEVAKDLPRGVKPVRLDWRQVSDNETTLYSKAKLDKIMQSFWINLSTSKPQGEIGDRITREVEVIEAKVVEDYWGTTTHHLFKDEEGNLYSWSTKAKTFTVGDKMNLTGTIKEISKYKNETCNILIRCKAN